MSSSKLLYSLQQALDIPSTRVPVGFTALASYVLPPVACYWVAAFLAVSPQTRIIQIAFWPITTLLAFRAAVSVDLSQGKLEQTFLNIDLVLSMVCIAVRTLDWALAKEPLARDVYPGNSTKSIVSNALDLASNLRGLGWTWSRGLYIPQETRPTNRIGFTFYTCFSAITHALVCGALHRAILLLAPIGGGPAPQASTIFDETLPFPAQYLRASIISVLTALAVYAILQTGYDVFTMAAILFFGQDPAQWPPAFDAPWRSTSLIDFWGRRWHQWFRRTFLFSGGHPLSYVFGRAGRILGAFLSSGVFHCIAMIALDGQAEMWRMLIGFGMMGPGILAERAFYKWTGRRVGGVVGWIWTMAWLIVWGNVMVEGFAKAGMFGCASFLDSTLPLRIPVERWVAGFDTWLHDIS